MNEKLDRRTLLKHAAVQIAAGVPLLTLSQIAESRVNPPQEIA